MSVDLERPTFDTRTRVLRVDKGVTIVSIASSANNNRGQYVSPNQRPSTCRCFDSRNLIYAAMYCEEIAYEGDVTLRVGVQSAAGGGDRVAIVIVVKLGQSKTLTNDYWCPVTKN